MDCSFDDFQLQLSLTAELQRMDWANEPAYTAPPLTLPMYTPTIYLPQTEGTTPPEQAEQAGPDDNSPKKSKGGRPKGVKNKTAEEKAEEAANKRGKGRPKGASNRPKGPDNPVKPRKEYTRRDPDKQRRHLELKQIERRRKARRAANDDRQDGVEHSGGLFSADAAVHAANGGWTGGAFDNMGTYATPPASVGSFSSGASDDTAALSHADWQALWQATASAEEQLQQTMASSEEQLQHSAPSTATDAVGGSTEAATESTANSEPGPMEEENGSGGGEEQMDAVSNGQPPDDGSAGALTGDADPYMGYDPDNQEFNELTDGFMNW